jgi:hypothetical protein
MIPHYRNAGILLAGVTVFVTALVVWGADGPVAGGDAAEFKTRQARDAMATYAGAAERLGREYQEKLSVARKTCLAGLTTAKEVATRAGNLDEAIRIRDTIAKLQAEAPAAPAADGGRGPLVTARENLTRQLAGTVWEPGVGKGFRLNADGTVTGGDRAGPASWAALDGSVVAVRWPDGWVHTYAFDEKLKTCTPTEFGFGTKKKEGARATSRQ